MNYQFLDFELDTNKKLLTFKDEPVTITKQNYELLLYFLNNPGVNRNKQEIIEAVWKGRVVSENTVDKSITKLRKVLNDVCPLDYFETTYGLGIKFIHEVKNQDKVEGKEKMESKSFAYTGLLLMLVLLVGVLVWKPWIMTDTVLSDAEGAIGGNYLLVLPIQNDDQQSVWLSQGTDQLINQVLGNSNNILMKDASRQPKNLNREQYLNQQWKITPELKVLHSEIQFIDQVLTLKFKLSDSQQNHWSHQFSGENLAFVITQANQWLIDQLDLSHDDASRLLADAYPLELYFKGLEAVGQGEAEKASKFFELCLLEREDFHLARLELARLKNTIGQTDGALALLDTLSVVQGLPQLHINVESLRGLIYEKTGQHDAAKQTYLDILNKYQDSGYLSLNEVRFNLSLTLTNMTENQQALELLNETIAHLQVQPFPELLAEVYRKKASILQKMGQTKAAKTETERAREVFNRLGDLVGEAKVLTLLSRMAQHEAKYEQAVEYLNQGLAIVRSMNSKIGIGATLNELIAVLMTQGHLEKAWELNQEMSQIATDLDYVFMQLASKQHFVDIARAQQKWLEAELYLTQHLEMATASNNQRALLNNQLMAIDLALDQQHVADLADKIAAIQQHIDDKEEVRMQPRLDRKLAKLYFLTGRAELAVELLTAAKQQAKNTSDSESLIAINNQLAEYWLSQSKPQRALQALEDSVTYQPLAYPYLLLKAEAFLQLDQPIRALELANECKHKAHDFWRTDDQLFLQDLVTQNH